MVEILSAMGSTFHPHYIDGKKGKGKGEEGKAEGDTRVKKERDPGWKILRGLEHTVGTQKAEGGVPRCPST